ncbi:MAG: acyltransferase [Actinobacteria bacterium]|nr:acyltransferase [Actinomycetota bacterium]
MLTQTARPVPGPAFDPRPTRVRGSRPHAAELDVVRPVASVLVILTHAMQMFAATGSIFYGAITLESQASRHVFFFVSALVLTWQAYQRPRWSPWRFWGRRGLIIVVPYALWVLIYWAVGLAGLHGDTIPGHAGSLLANVKSAGMQLITGPGHLYFVFVLMQFYLVFPLLLALLQRAQRWHWAILGASLAVQLVVTFALHYGHWTWSPWYDLGSTRQLSSYVFYLVAGAVIGAHLPAVRAWIWRHRWLVLIAAVAIILAVEAWYGLTVHSGQSATGTADPFSPEAIASYTGTFALLWMIGAFWANWSRGRPGRRASRSDGRLSRLVRTTSDNSYGVYLSHIVFLDILATLGLSRLNAHLPWPVTVLIAVLVAWTAASLLTVTLARTPLSRWLTGRARRPGRGGPPPVGWGTDLGSEARAGTEPGLAPAPDPGHPVQPSSTFPQQHHRSSENSQSTPGPDTGDISGPGATLTR